MGDNFQPDFVPQSPHLEWLIDHLDGWQFGEQGLLVAVVEKLGINGPVVEIGAGDGQRLPLTVDRLLDRSLPGSQLYEIDEASRQSLATIYRQDIVFGGYEGQSLPKNTSVCVIDIDGADSIAMRHVMQNDRPAVVVCEHLDRKYPCGTSHAMQIPPWMLGRKFREGHSIQDTAETLHKMAEEFGYERLGYNRCNSFFVKEELYVKLFG